jgi:hypothetical protein
VTNLGAKNKVARIGRYLRKNREALEPETILAAQETIISAFLGIQEEIARQKKERKKERRERINTKSGE